MLTNAKKELLDLLRGKSKVKCAEIKHERVYYASDELKEQTKLSSLPVGYTQEQWDKFMDSLDFNYNAGWGLQELYGLIWLEDGRWCDRGEYDGSEWWTYNIRPEIPEYLINPDLTNIQDHSDHI